MNIFIIDRNTIWLPSICGNSSVRDSFWNNEISINTSNPDFTDCFQKTILTVIPSFYLIIFAFCIYLPIIYRKENLHWKISKLAFLKFLISFILVVILIRKSFLPDFFPSWIFFSLSLLDIISITLSFVIVYVEVKRGLHSEGTLLIYWLLRCIVVGVVLRSYIIKGRIIFEIILQAIDFTLTIILLSLSIISDLERKKKRKKFVENDKDGERRPLLLNYNSTMSKETLNLKPCPKSEANFLFRLLFWWIIPLLIKGVKKPIEPKDCSELLINDKCTPLVNRFYKYWEKERNLSLKKSKEIKFPSISFSTDKHKKGQNRGILDSIDEIPLLDNSFENETKAKPVITHNYSVLKCLIFAYGPYFLYGGVFKLLYDITSFTNPFLINLLINFVISKENYQWQGFFLVALLFVIAMLKSCLLAHYNHVCFKTGMLLKSAIIGIVYRKSLKLNNESRQECSAGQITNLMSVDADKIKKAPLFFHMIWSTPLNIIIGVTLLYGELGISGIAGLGFMLIILPFNMLIANYVRKYQFAQMVLKDTRIKQISEILNGLKVLKLYAWEDAFEKRIITTRKNETKQLMKAALLNAYGAISWNMASYFLALITFATYVLSSENNVLDSNKAFFCLSIFNIMRYPMSILQPCIQYTVLTFVSIERIRKYLLLPELDQTNVQYNRHSSYSISVRDASFSWTNDNQTILKDISITVERSKLIAIVGKVGSGKSSLLLSMLGETKLQCGSIIASSMNWAYVSQEAWLRNASIQDNILFGKEMNKSKYKTIIEACSLIPDFEILEGGDQTEVGNKGINLSGGQKQRIALARAVYQNADIYFLDDPLSAVDAHVGKQLFDSVLSSSGGLLGNKTRILATNSINILPHVDTIFILDNGRITERGSYEQLISNNGNFAEFLNQYSDVKNGDDNYNKIAKSGNENNSTQRTISEFESSLSYKGSSISYDNEDDVDDMELDKHKHIGKLTKKEIAKTGKVKWSTYWQYFSSGGIFLCGILLVEHGCFIASELGTNIWLSKWSKDRIYTRKQVNWRLTIYGILGISQIIWILTRGITLSFLTTFSSVRLHNHLLLRLFRAPMRFFDTTPLGRIINRFSKDMDIVDTDMPLSLRIFIDVISPVISTIIIISITTPIFLVVLLCIAIAFYFVQLLYICTVRQLKRLESISASPIYSHFSETLSGISTIRAFSKTEDFVRISDSLTDTCQGFYFLNIVSSRWVSLSLEFLSNIVVFFSALFVVLKKDDIGPENAGLTISYALNAVSGLSLVILMYCDFERYIVSVERIKEYSEIELEADRNLPDDPKKDEWPTKGEIIFDDYSIRYRADTQLVLNSIKFQVDTCQRIAIVGRTGAGKSSLTMGLFRIIEADSGRILIDGRDISEIGLKSLRSKLTIIPQDPVLFSGSLRFNLDPLQEYTDQEIIKSLKQSCLSNLLKTSSLYYECGENGSNLSIGQKQLVCLARALLRNTKIIILDEATAAMDLDTDAIIQETIRNEFKNSTIITIAHRLKTIVDYDRVLVLDGGQLVEEGTYEELISNENSIFFSVAKNSGLV